MARRYERPSVVQVELKIEEAVLGSCKFQGSSNPSFQSLGLTGCYQLQTGGGYYLCQQAGS